MTELVAMNQKQHFLKILKMVKMKYLLFFACVPLTIP